ncbi:MFS transporter [Desemzia sp. RIT804]|uniref:MFS transporter n=1 Tax=Desemzia sp. RIT 804 TaxID=2810209 RepID=UPI00194F28F1|nr:MFS transporter [Desemzia sp. RIT 804]MBM6615462.1 MFS transporter [Desemzia sp. RIT 804]
MQESQHKEAAQASTFKLDVKEKLSYGLGDLGNGLMFQVAQLYLLKFYTDVLGISPYWGGMVFLITKFVDAVTDTLTGTYVDSRTPGSKGKFKPFILYGTGFLALTTISAFLAPDWGETAKIVYAFVSYNLMSLAYTIVNIPYGSLSSSMTTNAADRTSLAVFRNLAAQISILVAGVIVIPMVNQFSNPALGYPVVVGGLALLGVVCHILCYRGVEERFVSKKPHVKGDGVKSIKNLLTNAQFGVLAIYTILSIGAMFLKSGVQLYYFEYALGNEALVGTVSMLSLVAIIPSVLFATPIVEKFGKKNVALFGTAGFALFEFINYFFTGEETISFLIVNFLSYVFLGFANTVAFAFVSDVVDYSHLKNGNRTEGIIYSGYSFVRKVAQGFAGFIPGVALTAIGYVANQPQSVETLSGMRSVYFLFPAVLSVASAIIFLLFYKLTDERHAKVIQELSDKGEL